MSLSFWGTERRLRRRQNIQDNLTELVATAHFLLLLLLGHVLMWTSEG